MRYLLNCNLNQQGVNYPFSPSKLCSVANVSSNSPTPGAVGPGIFPDFRFEIVVAVVRVGFPQFADDDVLGNFLLGAAMAMASAGIAPFLSAPFSLLTSR